MTAPQVAFQVRYQSSATLAELGRRVGAALGCELAPSTDRQFEPGEALEASALGLQISLSTDPDQPAGTPRTFVVMGGLRPDLEARWELDADALDISLYVLALLSMCDGDGWYIASHDELLTEAGITDDDA